MCKGRSHNGKRHILASFSQVLRAHVCASVCPMGAFSHIPTHTQVILEQAAETHPATSTSDALTSPQPAAIPALRQPWPGQRDV